MFSLLQLLGTLQTQGRKGGAYDKALGVFVLVCVLTGFDGLTQGELDSLLLGLAGILATFVGGNAAEHGLRKTPPE